MSTRSGVWRGAPLAKAFVQYRSYGLSFSNTLINILYRGGQNNVMQLSIWILSTISLTLPPIFQSVLHKSHDWSQSEWGDPTPPCYTPRGNASIAEGWRFCFQLSISVFVFIFVFTFRLMCPTVRMNQSFSR